MPKARAETLLGMRLCLHDRLEQRDRGGADQLDAHRHKYERLTEKERVVQAMSRCCCS
jgi:hypothetical protein